MLNTSRANRPNRRDVAAAFHLALSITGLRSAARRILRQCSSYETGEALLLAVRTRAIEFSSTNPGHAPGEPPELTPLERVTDPALRVFRTRWRELSREEQRAAWSALCGEPFHAQLLRSAVARLDRSPTGSDSTSRGTLPPTRASGANTLPSDEDIP